MEKQYEVRIISTGKWYESIYASLERCLAYIAKIEYDYDYIKIIPLEAV